MVGRRRWWGARFWPDPPPRASRRSRPVRSAARPTTVNHAVLMAYSREGNRPRPMSLATRIRSSTRAWARCRASFTHVTVSAERDRPRALGDQRDRVSHSFGDREPHRIRNGVAPPPVLAGGVQPGEPAHQVMRDAGTIGAHLQVPTVLHGDLADRLAQHGDVVGRGVGPGTARAQHRRQRFLGVIALHRQRVVTVGAFERRRRALLV
jgi:hypothetical protein